MRNDSDRLQWQTEKNYIMNTFHNGLRRIQTDSKTAQQYVLLCLALAVAALIMVSGGSGEDVISVVFRPFVNFIRVIAWLAECLGVIYLFGYIPHSWSYYDDFSRAGICNQAHEAPLLVKANRDGNIQQLTFSLKGCPLEYWEDNRTTIESALNVTVLSITQGSNNQLFDLRVVAGCNLMGRLIPWADTWIQNQKEVDVMALGEGVTTHDVAWITLKDGGYILPIPTVTYRISKPLTNGMVYLRKNKACSKSAVPLQFALDYVYQDLKQKHAKYQHIWDKKQRYKWDRQPITNEQIALIHKLAPDYKIDTHKMTRGDASRAIQLLTYKPEEWTPQTTPSEVQDDAKKSP